MYTVVIFCIINNLWVTRLDLPGIVDQPHIQHWYVILRFQEYFGFLEQYFLCSEEGCNEKCLNCCNWFHWNFGVTLESLRLFSNLICLPFTALQSLRVNFFVLCRGELCIRAGYAMLEQQLGQWKHVFRNMYLQQWLFCLLFQKRI